MTDEMQEYLDAVENVNSKIRERMVNGLFYAPIDSQDEKSEMVYHAEGFGGGSEYMACSIAFDDWSVNGIDLSELEKPNPKQKYVTCPNCIDALEDQPFKKTSKGWKLK